MANLNNESLRYQMVQQQIEKRGIRNERLLEAMRKVERHRFIPASLAAYAYDDSPLPIREGQTISQPYIVASMTAQLDLQPEDRVLEVGTGSGYQAAILGELAGEVYSIEIIPELAEESKAILSELEYDHVHVKQGDGYLGWPEKAPFDAIIVTAAAPYVPEPLLDQLKPEGIMIIPVGHQGSVQELLKISKDQNGNIRREYLEPVRFVPLTRLPPEEDSHE